MTKGNSGVTLRSTDTQPTYCTRIVGDIIDDPYFKLDSRRNTPLSKMVTHSVSIPIQEGLILLNKWESMFPFRQDLIPVC